MVAVAARSLTGAGKGRGGSGETAMCACRAERLGLYITNITLLILHRLASRSKLWSLRKLCEDVLMKTVAFPYEAVDL